MWNQAHQVLEQMRLPCGLYLASPSDEYHYVWIRDNCYIALAYLNREDGRFEAAYHGMLDIFRKYLWKINHHTRVRPREAFEYVHPRYNADTLEELEQPWGNAQNDAIGAFLFGIGVGLDRGKPMLRDEMDEAVVQKLTEYLVYLQFWTDADNGMWEENREVHASSIGACVAGLIAIRRCVNVDDAVIANGIHALVDLYPRESATKSTDLAQLSLVYPYQILPNAFLKELVYRVEDQLLRESGVIRYRGDHYYRQGEREGEWTLGLSWLGLSWWTLGNIEKAREYAAWTQRSMPKPGVLPEIVLGVSRQPNPNTPLCWSVSMHMQLVERVGEDLSKTP